MTPELLFLFDLMAMFAVYLILNLSLCLEFGYGGIPNFGKVLFVAGGAYVVGGFTGRFASWLMGVVGYDYIRSNALVIFMINSRLSSDVWTSLVIFVPSILLAMAVGGALGYLASFPAIRLREDYLGMTLLSMGEVAKVIAHNYPDLVGGSLGVQVPDPLAWAGEWRFALASLVILAFAGLVWIYVDRVGRSPLGRTLRAIRDNETTAESLGKNISDYRMRTLVVSSAIAALCGGLYAFYTCGVVATTYSRMWWTFWPWLMVMLGGASSSRGVLVGTLLATSTIKLINVFKDVLQPFIPFDVVWAESMMIGATMILVLIRRPGGIFPEEPQVTSDMITAKPVEVQMSDTKS